MEGGAGKQQTGHGGGREGWTLDWDAETRKKCFNEIGALREEIDGVYWIVGLVGINDCVRL